jgi:hypothetical protein
MSDWTAQACAALWTLFEEAAEQANGALAAAGLDEQVQVSVRGNCCRVTLDGDEEGRHLIVYTGLRQLGSHLSGGAQISTSATRATIHLAPVLVADGPLWVVESTGDEFTVREVSDLLLTTFGDDGAALTRLLPYFSLESSV